MREVRWAFSIVSLIFWVFIQSSLFFGDQFPSSFCRPWTHILIWSSGFNFEIWLPFFPCAILWVLFLFWVFAFVTFLQLQNHITHCVTSIPISPLVISFQGSAAIWTGHSQACGAITWVVVLLSWILNPWIPLCWFTSHLAGIPCKIPSEKEIYRI